LKHTHLLVSIKEIKSHKENQSHQKFAEVLIQLVMSHPQAVPKVDTWRLPGDYFNTLSIAAATGDLSLYDETDVSASIWPPIKWFLTTHPTFPLECAWVLENCALGVKYMLARARATSIRIWHPTST
jgi:hypothetical protein